MKTTQHTPGPLAYGFTGTNGDCVITYHDKQRDLISRVATLRAEHICEEHGTAEEYAQFIVTACNSYYELLEALALAETTIERIAKRHGPFSSADGTLGVIRGAIAKAAIQSAQEKE